MKKTFAVSLILVIILCAVCATSFNAERVIGHKFETDDSFSRVGDLPDETEPETTEETQIEETTAQETIIIEETLGEVETTVEDNQDPTEPETVAETTAETTTDETITTTEETRTPATDDSVPPVISRKPHAVQTGDNELLFIGIGLLAVALIVLLVSMRKRTHSVEE